MLVGCALFVTSGCGGGDDGPPRYQLSGNATFAGKPIPKGFITFSPDASKGNSGPGSGAAIENGRYVTEEGKGVVGGPHVVKIVGTDGVPATESGEELPDGKSLFKPFEASADLPKENGEKDFDVPDSRD